MNPHLEILLDIPCAEHRPRAQRWCPDCGAPPAVTAELARLADERDQALIRAEAAEADVATLRRQLAEAETELEHVRGEFADAVGYEAAS
jgi:hypothetical protein